MDLRKLRQMHIDNGKESNINLDNSFPDSPVSDLPRIPKFGIQNKNGKTQLNTPIQPVYKNDPRYNEEKKKYNDRFSKGGYNIA